MFIMSFSSEAMLKHNLHMKVYNFEIDFPIK